MRASFILACWCRNVEQIRFYWSWSKELDSKEFEAHVILPNDGVLVETLRQLELRSACWIIRFYEGSILILKALPTIFALIISMLSKSLSMLENGRYGSIIQRLFWRASIWNTSSSCLWFGMFMRLSSNPKLFLTLSICSWDDMQTRLWRPKRSLIISSLISFLSR